MFDNPYIFFGLVFAAALLLVDTIFRAIGSIRRSNVELANRLEKIRKDKGAEVAFAELLKRRGLSGRDGQQDLGNRINQFIAQTGREYSKTSLVFGLVVLCLIGFVLAQFMLPVDLLIQVAFSVLFGFLAGFLILSWMRQRRIKIFTQQLAPALDIIVRSLRAGHPLTTAIALVSREMPDPIGSEFGIVSDQMTFGSDIEQAMLSMYDRVGATEIKMVTVSVSVQRSTGGNLAEIVENLAQMIRDRQLIKAKIKAISAEGRITAWIMLFFPFGLFYMIKFLVPTYFDMVWESGYGGMIVGICLIMIFFGMLIIRRLVNFDY
ncbi:type II secretion system F family protein [Marivita geojedonensis]|uniref:Type II secretion system protein GspF domain-containing protein n=1 Tax=Marivita geojedonensis TaxID=1123756 RepID=A0A1X4NCC9_9RHOB|nr:type II secretion system F family protein [Marivita geojedonensis]OSQ44324.1 hypothetical protein MGEO_19095 [Marivita geojedonensis]PRY72909.1 tight adherence protein B [Marivita geojedonensis]